MEKENILTSFISAWNWFIVSIVFLVGAFLSLVSGDKLINNVIFIVFLVMWALSTGISYTRRAKITLEDGLSGGGTFYE